MVEELDEWWSEDLAVLEEEIVERAESESALSHLVIPLVKQPELEHPF